MRRIAACVITLCLSLTIHPEHVKRVIDGDTFVLYHVGIGGEEHVRVLGVDTPERGEPGYHEATAFTRDWLARGPFMLIACQRDKYGRLLGAVTRHGESFEEELRNAGLVKQSKETAP